MGGILRQIPCEIGLFSREGAAVLVSIRIRRTFDRRSFRRGMGYALLLWQRLEQRWDENPGYVAAATAGTIGILLALAAWMLAS